MLLYVAVLCVLLAQTCRFWVEAIPILDVSTSNKNDTAELPFKVSNLMAGQSLGGPIYGPYSSPRPEQVKQKQGATCFMAAPLQGILRMPFLNPNWIKQQITEIPGNGVSFDKAQVTLWDRSGGAPTKITKEVLYPAAIEKTDSADGGAWWVGAYEVALVEAMKDKGKNVDTQGAGGRVKGTLELLAPPGWKVVLLTTDGKTDPATHQKASDMFEQAQTLPTFFGTGKPGPPFPADIADWESFERLNPGHAHMVLGHDDADGGKITYHDPFKDYSKNSEVKIADLLKFVKHIYQVQRERVTITSTSTKPKPTPTTATVNCANYPTGSAEASSGTETVVTSTSTLPIQRRQAEPACPTSGTTACGIPSLPPCPAPMPPGWFIPPPTCGIPPLPPCPPSCVYPGCVPPVPLPLGDDNDSTTTPSKASSTTATDASTTDTSTIATSTTSSPPPITPTQTLTPTSASSTTQPHAAVSTNADGSPCGGIGLPVCLCAAGVCDDDNKDSSTIESKSATPNPTSTSQTAESTGVESTKSSSQTETSTSSTTHTDSPTPGPTSTSQTSEPTGVNSTVSSTQTEASTASTITPATVSNTTTSTGTSTSTTSTPLTSTESTSTDSPTPEPTSTRQTSESTSVNSTVSTTQTEASTSSSIPPTAISNSTTSTGTSTSTTSTSLPGTAPTSTDSLTSDLTSTSQMSSSTGVNSTESSTKTTPSIPSTSKGGVTLRDIDNVHVDNNDDYTPSNGEGNLAGIDRNVHVEAIERP